MSAYYICEPAGMDHRIGRDGRSGSGKAALRYSPPGSRKADHEGRRLSFSSRTVVLGLLITFFLFGGFLMTAYATAGASDNSTSSASVIPASKPAAAEGTGVVIDAAPGDSLWSISSRYADGRSIRSYMKELKKINHLASTELQVGQLLRLPDSK